MNIIYNETDKSIEIKDGIKTHYFNMKIIMSLNLINAILNLYDVNNTGLGFIEIVWLIIGIASILFLFYFFYNKTTLEKIPVEKIDEIKEKSFLRKREFSFRLKDGKNRDLISIKTQSQYNELKNLLAAVGVVN